MEEELQELRESAALADRTPDADGLRAQVAALQRQNALLQAAASKNHRRRESAAAATGSPVDLDSRAATIEALELEISALNARVAAQQAANDEHIAERAALEARLREAQDAAAAAQGAPPVTEPKPKAEAAEGGGADLAVDLAAARARADALDRKVAALTALHRDTAARRAGDLAEAERLRTDLAHLRRKYLRRSAKGDDGADDDDEALDELEDEERARLERRVRELEAEAFDLRRGVWRQRRRSLQPGLDDRNHGDGSDDEAAAADFDDVDLSPVASALLPPPARAAPAKTSSSIADVINSGISAFAGGGATAMPPAGGRPRGQSMGLLDDDDFDFDEDGFRRAQEEEQAARIERVKETKRGLKKWEGWRMDIVHLRVAWGGVFEV
jgi:hypothetical protein